MCTALLCRGPAVNARMPIAGLDHVGDLDAVHRPESLGQALAIRSRGVLLARRHYTPGTASGSGCWRTGRPPPKGTPLAAFSGLPATSPPRMAVTAQFTPKGGRGIGG